LEELALPSVEANFKKQGVVPQPPPPEEAQALATRKSLKFFYKKELK
jgi:hypothetical protein